MANNFVPLSFPPGIVKSSSKALVQGRWNDGNLVRWIGDAIAPVGGWEQFSLDAAVASVVRAVHSWVDNSGILRYGVLCESNAYIIEGGAMTDITPIGGMTGAPADVTIGGYGDDVYNLGTYGTPRPNKASNSRTVGPAYSVDNWGEDFVFMSSYDGRLLRWSPSTPTVAAVAVPNAPTGCRLFLVTPERHVVLFGPNGEDNRFQWCDQEDIENWTVATTTTAGFYDIEPFSPIIAAVVIKNGFVFFTSVGPYFSRYIGVPYIYSYDPISGGSVPYTDAALTEANGRAIWFSEEGFWTTDGISIEPVPCPMLKYTQDLFNEFYVRYRMVSVNIGAYPEVWWFYPSGDQTENDRYISYDYVSKWWSMGKLVRTCGVSASFNSYPVMSDGTDFFKHESSNFYTDLVELPYAETGAINSKGGAVLTYVDQFMVDHNGPKEICEYTIKGYISRMNQEEEGPVVTIGPKRARDDGYLDARLTARDITLRIQSSVNGGQPWTFGQPLINAVPKGSR